MELMGHRISDNLDALMSTLRKAACVCPRVMHRRAHFKWYLLFTMLTLFSAFAFCRRFSGARRQLLGTCVAANRHMQDTRIAWWRACSQAPASSCEGTSTLQETADIESSGMAETHKSPQTRELTEGRQSID